MKSHDMSRRGFKINLVWLASLAAIPAFVSSQTHGPCTENSGQTSADKPRRIGKEGDATSAVDATERYEARQIEDWTVLVNKQFLAQQPMLAQETLAILRQQLGQVARRLPVAAVNKLRTIRIWVEEREPDPPCMTYHPSADWLREHGKNADKARSVELANARNFLEWTHEQPWMVLHELSHGYHHQFVERGFKNPEITRAFDNAMKSKRYESVERKRGGTREKAYAATDPMEYFAEASEAYFGTNDFYPFDRSDLEKHDPEMFALVEKLWWARPGKKQ